MGSDKAFSGEEKVWIQVQADPCTQDPQDLGIRIRKGTVVSAVPDAAKALAVLGG